MFVSNHADDKGVAVTLILSKSASVVLYRMGPNHAACWFGKTLDFAESGKLDVDKYGKLDVGVS